MGHANTSRTGTSKLSTENVRALNMKIESAYYRKLEEHARSKGMSVSGFAKKLVKEYVDTHVER